MASCKRAVHKLRDLPGSILVYTDRESVCDEIENLSDDHETHARPPQPILEIR